MVRAQIVDTLPAVADANPNVIYLIKDNTVTGNDKYKEYMLIDNEMVMIGDTSVSLAGYATEQYVSDRISALDIPVIESATTAEIQALFATTP